MNTKTYFEDCDRRFDEDWGLVGKSFTSPGYHTRVPTGEWVHQTVTSLEYAVLGLRYGNESQRKRACIAIGKVLDLQHTEPTHAYYGIFPYLAEEPVDQMELIDPNWADFCGMRLCEALKEPGGHLPDPLVERIKTGIGHAAASIFRRNIQPSYTNIAIMGGGLCAAAGEILDEKWLLDYGRCRLANVVEAAQHHGAYNEYNSPTYTTIALRETERILYLCRDEEVGKSARALNRIAWTMIADHFHPGTSQWAGPHSRAYQNLVDETLMTDLNLRLDMDLPALPGQPDYVWTGPLDVCLESFQPCPEDLKPRFKALPEEPYEIRQTFSRRENSEDTVGTTWFDRDSTLGSVSRDNCFYQRRLCVGYWKTETEKPAILRARFLHDGRDFSSAFFRSRQKGTRVLGAFNLLSGMGDYALHMDIPKGGIFMAEDFRLRIELNHSDARVEELKEGRYRLTAANHCAVVHSIPGLFQGSPVQWEFGSSDEGCWVDAVCYQGEKKGFRMEDCTPVELGFGLEMLRSDEEPLTTAPRVEPSDKAINFSWDEAGMESFSSPTQTEPYIWA